MVMMLLPRTTCRRAGQENRNHQSHALPNTATHIAALGFVKLPLCTTGNAQQHGQGSTGLTDDEAGFRRSTSPPRSKLFNACHPMASSCQPHCVLSHSGAHSLGQAGVRSMGCASSRSPHGSSGGMQCACLPRPMHAFAFAAPCCSPVLGSPPCQCPASASRPLSSPAPGS